MTAAPITDLTRLCVHTITTRPWSLAEAIRQYQAAGVTGVTVWRQSYETEGVATAAQMLADSSLHVVSLCRGGFFPGTSADQRQQAIDENRQIIDEAATIGAPLVVLVCGAVSGMPLAQARAQIAEGIAAVIDHAGQVGVRLAIEPLHPMYADSRSAINTLRQANDIVEAINHPHLGVTVDVYHLWWDPELERQIHRAGNRVFSFHVCDWRTPTRDLLNDRELMGQGCIDIPRIRQWVEATGFAGHNEVEIFSNHYWQEDQQEFLQKITRAYLKHV